MDTTPLPFTPVPLRARRDGWTPERQRAFILALAETRCVSKASASVGMARETAYRLRDRAGAASFAAAWDAALVPPTRDVEARVLHGVLVPRMFRGKQIGWRRKFDARVLFNVFRAHFFAGPRAAGFPWMSRERPRSHECCDLRTLTPTRKFEALPLCTPLP